jgi:acetyl esterase/lipase
MFPLVAADFHGLPPAHIHTAEFDLLRDEGKLYGDRLRADGVAVQYTCHAGMVHHFYGMAGAVPQARVALESVGVAIRDALVTITAST